ncbi:MAG: hypothetical protein SA339_05805 [Methanomassiliicoccus sp.]|nr:hypothetical protein [Methanomassiliicoccus sp.]
MKKFGEARKTMAIGTIVVMIAFVLVAMTPVVSANSGTFTAPYTSCNAWTNYGVTTQYGSVIATPTAPSMSASNGYGTMGAHIETGINSYATIVEKIGLSGCEFIAGSTSQYVKSTWYTTASGQYHTDTSGGTVQVYIIIFMSLFDVDSSTSRTEVGTYVLQMSYSDVTIKHTFGGPWTVATGYTWTGLTQNHHYIVQDTLELYAYCSSVGGNGYLTVNVGGTCQSIVLQ